PNALTGERLECARSRLECRATQEGFHRLGRRKWLRFPQLPGLFRFPWRNGCFGSAQGTRPQVGPRLPRLRETILLFAAVGFYRLEEDVGQLQPCHRFEKLLRAENVSRPLGEPKQAHLVRDGWPGE